MKERLKSLYKEVETLLNLAPCEEDCSDEDSSSGLNGSLDDISSGFSSDED